MSNFWSNAFAPAAPAPQQAQAQRVDRPWWQTSFVPQTNSPSSVAVIEDGRELTVRNQATRSTSGTCPSCGSGNFYIPAGGRTASRCFECGYNAVGYDLSGFGTSGAGGPTTHTRQSATTMTGFHPDTIVARIAENGATSVTA